MRAMVLEKPGHPLSLSELAEPRPQAHQILIQVSVCAVCRTDLHICDGELKKPKLPLIPGHQIVGTVVGRGREARRFQTGERVGAGWLGSVCRTCPYCAGGLENLCDRAVFTGYGIDGGYAEYTAVDEDFCFRIPAEFPDLQAAPLMCAGLIGYRSYRMVRDADNIGFFGFGAAAHILTQIALFEKKRVFAFVRKNDEAARKFALGLGAVWAGASTEDPPIALDAAIIFAPAGELVPRALACVKKGATVVCAGIHMSDIPAFPYELLWGERMVRSVANLTREDGEEFLRIAPRVPVTTHVKTYALEEANAALNDLRDGKFNGSAVLLL